MSTEEYPEMTNDEYRGKIAEIIGNIKDSQVLRYLYIITNEIINGGLKYEDF